MQFNDKSVSSKEVLDASKTKNGSMLDEKLHEAIADLAGVDFPQNTKRLSKIIIYRKDIIINWLCLEAGEPDRHNKVARWRVVEVESKRDESGGENDIERF